MLPGVLPENFMFVLAGGKSIVFSYLCTMLNQLVYAQLTNHQYHNLDPAMSTYTICSEKLIFFKLNGPYKETISPSSEAGKLLKKCYTVFNGDSSLAKLKSFRTSVARATIGP
jgi:DNA polymerase epsilon subunit 1